MHSTAILWTFAALIRNCLSDDAAPKAIVIPASEYFEGNDGPWSSFNVRVGTPEQDVRVLVSTASPQSMVALSDYGCSPSVFTTVPPNCAVSRGNLFDLNKSTSWHDMGTFGINQNGVGLEANLGYTQRAQFGLEHLGLGLTGPSLDNQTVAGIATAEPFYLGIFGLNNQPVNFSSLGNYSSPSFLTSLKMQNQIPSLSWSYTAGAKYRLKQVYGQLILSGYDTSRFRENTVSFTMAGDVTRDLVVALQSISYSGSSSTTLLSNSIDILIDSTDPNIWLPGEACDAFEKTFGLSLDNKTGLYLVNDTQRNTLLNSDAQVAFRISDVKTGGDTVTITLPYAAFDTTAEYPLVDNSTHYFPLKRANSSTQYTLGRVFLQEAYLSADYERKTFNVSACVWNEGANENIITIASGNPDSAGNGGSGSSGGSHLDGKTIAGIVVACVVGSILIAILIAVVVLRKRRKWISKGFSVAGIKPEPDNSVLNGPVFNANRQSTAGSSMPFSSEDVSAPRSTMDGSVSAADSPARPATVDENVVAHTTLSELDGHNTLEKGEGGEFAAQNSNIGTITPVAKNPGIYELPGSEVTSGRINKIGTDPNPSTIGSTLLHDERKLGDSSISPSSPTTHGSISKRKERPRSDLVSPVTPVHP